MSENFSKITAQKLLNLYRQSHVILGGWAVLNPYFVSEANTDVLNELKKMPNGWKLVQHIENLKNKQTKMDSIEPDLEPYGGLMNVDTIYNKFVQDKSLTEDEFQKMSSLLRNFQPNLNYLNSFKNASFFKNLGKNWEEELMQIISESNFADKSLLLNKFRQLLDLNKTYDIWFKAGNLIENPVDNKVCAEAQTMLADFETYLPRFGDAGKELLSKIRKLTSLKGDK